MAMTALAVAWICLTPAGAVEVILQSPLTTQVHLAGGLAGGDLIVNATLSVPEDAPIDLGVGVAVVDEHGRWFQATRPGTLAPGRHRLTWPIGPRDRLDEVDADGIWNAALAAQARSVRLFFWSTAASRSRLLLTDVQVATAMVGAAAPHPSLPTARLGEFTLIEPLRSPPCTVSTGERWAIGLVPMPFPANPYDAGEFSGSATIRAPDGSEQTIPAFADEPMALFDRGDREGATPAGPMRFVIRFRPRQPGRHQVTIVGRWGNGSSCTSVLPDLLVEGPAWDGYVRVDRTDPRFFSVADAWWWPIGLNMHTPWDLRCRETLGTQLTPDRGTETYSAYLDRFAAAGGMAIEVWLSAWNLGLEWNRSWPGYQGLGRYNQANAARMDRLLDLAWRRGVRVNFVISNHGQASARVDSEWATNPWNTANGGPLGNPYQLFTDARALHGQALLRRYLVARYADHPAVLSWKLWTEIDLTAAGSEPRAALPPRLARMRGTGESTTAKGKPAAEALGDPADRRENLLRWHRAAAAHVQSLDGYGHPITTHWSSSYRRVDPDIAALGGIDALCIDAYRTTAPDSADEGGAAQLIWASVADTSLGLARYRKPVLITEYGGSAQAGDEALILADHASGAWAALVGGHAGSPMLWWHEWVDQGDRWKPYRAVQTFLSGEDLRGGQSRPAQVINSDVAIDAMTWIQSNRILAYLVARSWSRTGHASVESKGARIVLTLLPPGRWHWHWWDADRGTPTQSGHVEHRGGDFDLPIPPMSRHLALKLVRVHESLR